MTRTGPFRLREIVFAPDAPWTVRTGAGVGE
jgi:hypothetical protein